MTFGLSPGVGFIAIQLFFFSPFNFIEVSSHFGAKLDFVVGDVGYSYKILQGYNIVVSTVFDFNPDPWDFMIQIDLRICFQMGGLTTNKS